MHKTEQISKGELSCAKCHGTIKSNSLGPVLCSNCKNEVINTAFGHECFAILPSPAYSDKLYIYCCKPAKFWNDLYSEQYGKDEDPYCIEHHQQELLYLNSKCRKCEQKRKMCMCYA